MARTCDHCGGEMTFRSHEADKAAAASTTSSATWWDCGCGRTIGEFAASTRLGAAVYDGERPEVGAILHGACERQVDLHDGAAPLAVRRSIVSP